jgi:prepilin-type N-terminal cleavage/methylation domain-containing protein
MARATSAAAGDQGFTLLEVLVGLAISSLIMVGLSLAMRSINQGYDSTTQTIQRQGTMTTGLQVVTQDISRIERAVDDLNQPKRFLFSGRPREVIYVLAERPGNNSAGLYWVRLLVRDATDGEELVRMRAPFRRNEAELTAIGWDDEVVLLKGGVGIGLAYRAPRAGLRNWASSWDATTMLPGQIKIEITDLATGRLRAPALVGTLKIGAEASCTSADAPGCTLKSEGVLIATVPRQ